MELKEKILKEIDDISNHYLSQPERYLEIITSDEQKKSPIKFHLKGKFDNLDVRKRAYE